MSPRSEPFPRSQHWTIQGFRISVLLYKRNTGPCATCGERPARHTAWADDGKGTGGGFSAAPVNFCDRHRPAKGTLPPLTYERLLSGGDAGYAYEGWRPYPEACTVCGGPAELRYGVRCQGCDDLRFYYSTRRIVPFGDGTTGEEAPEFHHRPHELATPFRCREHPLTLARTS